MHVKIWEPLICGIYKGCVSIDKFVDSKINYFKQQDPPSPHPDEVIIIIIRYYSHLTYKKTKVQRN